MCTLILLGVSETICFDSGRQLWQKHIQICHQIHPVAVTSTTLPNPCQSMLVRPASKVTRVPAWTVARFQLIHPLTGSNLFLIFPYLFMGFFNTLIHAPALFSGLNVSSPSLVFTTPWYLQRSQLHHFLPSFCYTRQPFPEHFWSPSLCFFSPSTFLLNHSHIIPVSSNVNSILPCCAMGKAFHRSRGMKITVKSCIKPYHCLILHED